MDKNFICYICEREESPDKKGFTLFGKPVCISCEQKIILADIEDSTYLHLKDRIKKLWLNST